MNSNTGYAAFWNKTFSQFNPFKAKGESRNNVDETSNANIELNNRSNSFVEGGAAAAATSAASAASSSTGVLLNSYLTYVTLNLQSIMNGNFTLLYSKNLF